MKLVVLCLFAVCCYSLANTTTANGPNEIILRRKLEEVLRQLNEVRENLQHEEKMLNTPPENIEDCCCVSALRCFRDNLKVHFNDTERKQRKLFKSLQSPLTERGLAFCESGNNTVSQSSCQGCESHPKAKVQDFFNRLESLIQRGITKLSMK
ncbi:interleukin-21 [Trachinotus anak]|uniref:Interleukin n=1 Tax=Trachinotus ovatus TaxID=173339 RepID=A0A3S8UUW5_TRAOV|nr:interleukin-21 [Trachinotus ovatus]